MANIDERLESLTQSVELLTHDVRELQTTVKELIGTTGKLVEMQGRTDKRISDLLTITLKIGANFSERIRALEEKDGEE